MKKAFWSLVLVWCIGSTHAQQKITPTTTLSLQRPKLVVGLVVDQMRWDYLFRFYNRYGEAGFKRLLNEGFSCDNTQIPYAATVTAPGHTTVYTGSIPAIHGITENDFIIQSTGKSMYCVADSSVQSIGGSVKAGKMSPRNLLTTTVTDELKIATNSRSKVIGIALKDRGAILPAGHMADAAYWFDDVSGNWISSTFYMKDLPQWLKNFNAQKLPEKYLSQDWNTLYPIETYTASLPDSNSYERKIKGTEAPIFPIKTSQLFSKDLGVIRTTPFGNTLTLDLAKAIISNEEMGIDSETDFLAVSCSSTDYVGHDFGPKSIEVEDTFLRLDKDLASFFTFLDNRVGKGNYTLFLTADHGGAEVAQFLKDRKIPAGIWPEKEISKRLSAQLEKDFGHQNLTLSLDNYQVSLNTNLIKSVGLDEAAIRKSCVEFLKRQQGVEYVLDMKNPEQESIPAFIKTRLINSYHPDRSGAIFVVLNPGWYHSSDVTGTTHGSWNPYDSHIPLLLMGWGIKKGKTNRSIYMTDIAPTISTLLHIQMPNGAVGTPITEALK